jgi:adenylosuccinate lyase
MPRETVFKFNQTSPTDFRYEVKDLLPYFSEDAFIAYKSRVEAALAFTLAKRGIISQDSAAKISDAAKKVVAEEVYDEENRTGHDIIAQVNMIKKNLESEEARTAVHRTATSYDIIDSANALRLKDGFYKVIIPDMIAFERALITTAKREKDTLQIGRTHLQHAEPITFGFSIASFVSRFGGRILAVKRAVDSLEGKFSGAVGTHSAAGLFVEDPIEFENDVLGYLGLKPTEISTQITQPEPLVDLAHAVETSFSVLANWAWNMYLLQQPEIAEVSQPRGKDISRSSTMPNKANPVGLENILGHYEKAVPEMQTYYSNEISIHQRCLINSVPERYVPDFFTRFDYSVRRATRIASSLIVREENMRRNFNMSSGYITAEPLQLLLSSYGYPNAHEAMGKMSDKAYASGRPVLEVVSEDKDTKEYLGRFTQKQLDLMRNPSKYVGAAPHKAESVANSWTQKMEDLESSLRAR